MTAWARNRDRGFQWLCPPRDLFPNSTIIANFRGLLTDSLLCFSAILLLESAPQENFTSAHEDLSHLPKDLPGRFFPLSPRRRSSHRPGHGDRSAACRRAVPPFSPCPPPGQRGHGWAQNRPPCKPPGTMLSCGGVMKLKFLTALLLLLASLGSLLAPRKPRSL